MELKHRKPPSHRGRIQKPFGLQCFTHETTNQTTEATSKFVNVLEALPHSRLADAAARAHAAARAVLSYELDAKAQHEAWRKRQPKGKEYNDGADGWLPRLDPRSLERLQKAGAPGAVPAGLSWRRRCLGGRGARLKARAGVLNPADAAGE